jgi:hypothetical protein
MAGGQVQGRRPAGRSRGPVARRCDPAAGQAASRVTGWGYVVWGYLPGQHRETNSGTGSKPLKRGGAPMPTDITDKSPFRQFCQCRIRGYARNRGRSSWREAWSRERASGEPVAPAA